MTIETHFSLEEENIPKVSALISRYLSLSYPSKNSQKPWGGRCPQVNWGVLCIGTDRITGDCLGPMVGSRLLERSRDMHHPLLVCGTLEHPVHALNLHRILPALRKKYPRHRFLAVDAALGPDKYLGNVMVSPAPLKPGGGMGKTLAGAGDVSITGIVGSEDCCPDLVLPCTRLYLVDRLAEFICRSILQSYKMAGSSSLD